MTQEKLLAAAIDCFARLGHNGVSTREIARVAGINEVTLYRHYPSKKELYGAAMESQLKQLRFRADLLGKLRSAKTLQAAILALVELFSDAVAQEPHFVRLLHFGVLEFGAELHPIFLQHMREVLDAMSESISRAAKAEGIVNLDERVVVLAVISSIASLEMLYPLIWGNSHDGDSAAMTPTYGRLWSAVFVPESHETGLGDTAPQQVSEN